MTEQQADEWAAEVVDDVEIYEGAPDADYAQANEHGDQDDEIPLGGGIALFAKTDSNVRDVPGVLAWYATHQTAQQIGFDPDGMCYKVCRTARNIGPKYLTAKAGQDATPEEFRFRHVRDLRKGMILYFDDAKDSNRSGHVATLIGRVAGFDPDNLADCLVETNSVVANQVVVVRGDYFMKHWGDSFQFGATWMNGVRFPMNTFVSKIEKFNTGGPIYRLNLLKRAAADRPAAQEALDGIIRQVNQLPDNPKLTRIREFKNKVRSKEQILDIGLLNEAASHARRGGRTQRARDEIVRIIESLPDV